MFGEHSLEVYRGEDAAVNDQRTKTIALIVAGVIVALLLGIGGGWLIWGSEVSVLEDRVAELENTDDTTILEESGETEEPETDAEKPIVEEPAVTEAEEAAGANNGTQAVVTERQPGLIVAIIGAPGAYTMRIDYVLWLTGPEANAAATAHGDESPPPNDYYVVNDNPKIREFPIKPGIPVTVVTNADGTSDAEGHTITLDEWVAALSGPSAHAFKATIYWTTITDGTVTAIEAQYVP